MAEREGFEPPVPFRARRFSSTQKCSDPLGKFSTLLHFSTAYKSHPLTRYDPFCTIVTVELLQFYYRRNEVIDLRRREGNSYYFSL